MRSLVRCHDRQGDQDTSGLVEMSREDVTQMLAKAWPSRSLWLYKPASEPNPTHLGERAVPGLPVPSPTKLASTLKNLVSGVKEAFSQ